MDGTWIPILAITMGPVIAIGYPLARAYAKRMESGATTPHTSSDVAMRLERMEQAIDSIAVEVERISEGQRFTTRLLADRTPAAGPGGPPGAIPVLENPPPRDG